MGEPTDLWLSGEGLEVQNYESQARHQWSLFNGVFETRGQFHLRLRPGATGATLFLPKRWVDTETCDRIRLLLTEVESSLSPGPTLWRRARPVVAWVLLVLATVVALNFLRH